MAPNAGQRFPVETLWAQRRQLSDQQKAYKCDYPGCTLSYNIKCNLLRHQTTKHGRKKVERKGLTPTLVDFNRHIYHPNVPSQHSEENGEKNSENGEMVAGSSVENEFSDSSVHVGDVMPVYKENFEAENEDCGAAELADMTGTGQGENEPESENQKEFKSFNIKDEIQNLSECHF